MLLNLAIHRIAVIENVQIEFHNGLNILTGETGAGKSIIIDALNMILGNRASKNLIRTGEETAAVSAIFAVSSPIEECLAENGYDCEEHELLIYREISLSGKSVVRINGKPATASILKAVSEYLINIHGQHDNQSLLNPEKHLSILDEFCRHEDKVTAYKICYRKYKEAEKAFRQLQINEEEKERKLRMLEFEIDEIEGANLKIDEEDELLERRHLLSHAQHILKNINRAYELLYANAYENMGDAVKNIEQAYECDASLEQLKDSAYDAYYNMESVVEALRSYRDNFSYDESKVNAIEERLSLINDLKRRYGNSVTLILQYLENAKNELSDLLHIEEKCRQLKEQYDNAALSLRAAADVLTISRQEGAKRMQQQIQQELSDLNMPNTRFEVEFIPFKDIEDYTEKGQEKAEFLLSANVGQKPDKLSQIASGGELSRIMLAIKSAVFEKEGADTLIFDEIDTGVSGRAAQKIAEKLYRVSKNRQVLCVTHLPQIAAMADYHYLIEKKVEEEHTRTSVKMLEEQEKTEEIARIIGGVKITGAALEHAAEMVALSKEYKREQ